MRADSVFGEYSTNLINRHISWKRKSVRKSQHHEGFRCVATTHPIKVAPFKSAIFPESSKKLLRRGDYDLIKMRYRYDCLRVSTHIPQYSSRRLEHFLTIRAAIVHFVPKQQHIGISSEHIV